MIQEIWKTLPRDTDYEVSNLGQVRRAKPKIVIGKDGRKMTFRARLCKQTRGKKRQQMRVKINRKTCLVHVLVLETFVGPCPPGLEGCHNDGNGYNNVLSNLRWDTRESNIKDTFAHGVRKRSVRAVFFPRVRGRQLVSAYVCGEAALI